MLVLLTFFFALKFELVHRGTNDGVMTVLESVGLFWVDDVDVVIHLTGIFFDHSVSMSLDVFVGPIVEHVLIKY